MTTKIGWIVAGGAALLGIVVLVGRSQEAQAPRARALRARGEDRSAQTAERFGSPEPVRIDSQMAPRAVGWTAQIAPVERTRPEVRPVPPPAPSLLPDVWVHEGDSDGDGLMDEFELRHGLDPRKVCTFDDGIPDEQRIAPDGRTYGEIQGAEKRGEPCRHEHWANPAVSGRK